MGPRVWTLRAHVGLEWTCHVLALWLLLLLVAMIHCPLPTIKGLPKQAESESARERKRETEWVCVGEKWKIEEGDKQKTTEKEEIFVEQEKTIMWKF